MKQKAKARRKVTNPKSPWRHEPAFASKRHRPEPAPMPARPITEIERAELFFRDEQKDLSS